MRKETTIQHIEYKKTSYFCEEKGCDFNTTDQWEAEQHPWREHNAFKEAHIEITPPKDKIRATATMVFFENEEAFMKYQEINEAAEQLYVDPWRGPGWYEVWSDIIPCSRGCCAKDALFIQSATKTREALQRIHQKIGDALKRLDTLEVPHVVG